MVFTRKKNMVIMGACVFLMFIFSISVAVSLAQEKTVLKYWDFLDLEAATPRSKIRKAIFDEFLRKNPNIQLDAAVYPAHFIPSEIIKAQAMNRAPDVALVFSDDEGILIDADSLYPLDEYASELYKGDWIQPWEETGYYNGHKYFLPWEIRAMVLYYRADLFAKAGFTVPTTWDETIKIAKALTSPDLQGMVWGLSMKEEGVAFQEPFEALLVGLGARLFDEETDYPLYQYKEGQKLFQLCYDLIKKHKVMSEVVLGYKYDDVHESIKTGRALMIMLGCHRLETVREGPLGNNVKTAPLPGFEGYSVPSNTTMTRWGLCLPKNTPLSHQTPEYREAALDFIRWVKSVEAELMMAESGELPARISTWDNPLLPEKFPDAEERYKWKEYCLEKGVDTYKSPKAAANRVYLAEAIGKMIQEDLPAKEVLYEAAERYIKIMEE